MYRYPVLAWVCYGLSIAAIVGGTLLAVRSYPKAFDWTLTVISALASRKHNPEGSLWFAGALVIALGLLWPVSAVIRTARTPALLLRVGLVCGMLVGTERLVFVHFSDLVHKGHELIALTAFLAIYGGVLGLELDHVRRRSAGRWVSLLVLLPLVAAGILALVLYLAQRDTGWVDHDWKKENLPVWARFAFWQWLAVAALWVGVGHLLLLSSSSRERHDPVRHDRLVSG